MVQSPALGNAPALLKQLPELLFLSDVVFYVFGALFFGSIAMKGFKGYLHFLPHFLLRVLMGVISLMGGLALQGFFPSLSQGIYQLFNADILAGSLITSVLLGVGMYLVSYRLINVQVLTKRIEKLEASIEKAKKIPKERLGWRDPIKILGIVVIVIAVGFSLIQFRGFTSMSDNFLSFLGLSQQDLKELSEQFEKIETAEKNLPQGCVSILTILQTSGPDITKLPKSTDQNIKTLIEQNAGANVADMRVAVVEGKQYVIAVTDDSQLCSATQTQFCSCINLSELLPST